MLFNILKSQILLYSCSTVSVAINSDMIINIRKWAPDERLTAFTNGRTQTYNEMAELVMFLITVYFKESSMAKIISIKDVTSIEGAFWTYCWTIVWW